MLQNIWFVAAIWMGLALAASLVSIWTGISVALIEIVVGVFAGNVFHLQANNEWIGFLAMLGSGVLTFLAGAEIDPRSLRENLRASALIGVISFAVPFALVWLFAQFVLGWSLHQAQIAGIALSTTSVAVVYAVLIEGGYSDTAMGKMILGGVFHHRFRHGARARRTLRELQRLADRFRRGHVRRALVHAGLDEIDHRPSRRVARERAGSEVHLLHPLFLGGLATAAKSEAVLPAYLVGLVVAGVFLRDKTLVHRMRSIAFAMFTPFYFIRAGLFVSLPALWPAITIVAGLLLLKMVTKVVGVWPLARMHFMSRHQAAYTTLLMATGLTFGTISALVRFPKQNHRPAPIHHPRHGRDLERVRANALRAEIFPANKRCDARVGKALSPRPRDPIGRRQVNGRCRNH